MNKVRTRLGLSGERGFSLIELLVVIVILGILLAIAIPQFLGAKNQGNDSQPQSALRAALSAERTYYVDFQIYTTDVDKLRAIEPNVVWNSTDGKIGGVMAATNVAGNGVVLVSASLSGNVFCIMNLATDVSLGGQTQAGTYYGSAAASTPPTTVTTDQCGSDVGSYSRDASIGWDTD